MRKGSLYMITVITFSLIIFNMLACLFVPFLKFIDSNFVHTLVIIELCIWTLVCLSSFFFKRAHCSHSCAISGVFEIISNKVKSKDIMSASYPIKLKYIMLFLWFFGFGYILVCLLGNQLQWFHVATIYTDPLVGIYYLLFWISGILSITIGKSQVAHYVCPFSPWMLTGIKCGKRLRIPSFTIVTDADKCVKCKQCNRVCLINQDVCNKVINETFDQSECTNCFSCVKTCKSGALESKWTR